MDLEFWATTDVGRVRDHNEDNFLIDKRLQLFVVCDGMGGHAAGEVASAMSVQIVREVLREHAEIFDRLNEDPESLAHRKSVLTLVEHAIHEACARIFHAAVEDPAKKGMGTTCSVLLLAQGRGFIGHVGDSRIYLYRQNAIHQVTEDHSLINEMIRLGKIKKGEEHNLPHKNAVTRAVGVNEFVDAETWELDVFKGDCFLLCSDGLSGYFKDDSQIVALVDQEDIKKIPQDCIDFANRGGGKDNITAIAIRVKGTQKHTGNLQQKIEVMRANSIFRYLSQKELVQVISLSESESVEAGDWVFEKGADPGAMYLIVEGTVALVRDEKDLSLGPGEVVGEMAMIDETPQELGARALEDCEFLVIRRDRFMGLLRSDESLAVKLLWNFLQVWTFRLRKFSYEQQRSRPRGIDESTPPSGNLAFADDRKDDAPESDPSDDAEAAEEADVDATVRSAGATTAKALKDKLRHSAMAGELSAERREARTMPADSSIAPRMAQRATLDPDKTVPDSGLGAMAWDDIIPPDLLEDEESLRETMQMDRDTGAMSPTQSRRESTSSEARNGGLGKPISGESTTRSTTPQAQVLKRTKLVVGEGEFDAKEHTRTRDVKPLKKKPDTTLELEIDDDNVEEIN